MRLPNFIVEPLFRWGMRRATKTRPDFVIGDQYLQRWWITPWSGLYRDVKHKTWWQWLVTRLPGVYLHLFSGSDDDRALHDHPWPSCSILLMGGYYEHVPKDPQRPDGATIAIWRPERTITFRRSRAPHRIEMRADEEHHVMTLFITGFRLRESGFHCPHGWRPWQLFTSPKDKGQVGRGCD